MKIIAEIGQNHDGDIDLAIELIDLAAQAGAHIAKFQLYNAKKLFPGPDANPWYEYNLSTELTYEHLSRLVKHCKDRKIQFMASVFDEERLGWLERQSVAMHKIASRSVTDTGLVNKVLSTGKPTLLSLGQWQKPFLPFNSHSNLPLYLHCISQYPAPLHSLNLFEVDFSLISGFSDHSEGIHASIAAIALGAEYIEKHFTIDKTRFGPDHSCSMIPSELFELSSFANSIKEIKGT